MSNPKKRRVSRARPCALPKGAYRHPSGGYVTKAMIGTDKKGRRLSVVALRRDPPDIEKLARAFLEIAKQQGRDRNRD